MADGADNLEPPEEASSGAGDGFDSSLFGDVESLIDDGRTYAEAELAFQKTRLSFVLEHAKGIAVLGGIAAIFVVLAIIVLVVGTLIGLIPMLGPWGATAAVCGALLVLAGVLGLVAKLKVAAIKRAFEADAE